jgi:tRNA A22 N-methylase
MICPLCFDALTFWDERSCYEVLDCQCEEGYVGMYICKNHNCAITFITIVEGCLECESKR